MTDSFQLSSLNHNQIREWLKRALVGLEPLPLVTPDEAFHLGILRLEMALEPAPRSSLRRACRELIRDFCTEGKGEEEYLQGLLHLASGVKDPETAEDLGILARRLSDLPQVTMRTRLNVLAALVVMPPPRSQGFWEEILARDPDHYAALVLSGLLAINPPAAVAMLPKMPNTERMGQAAVLKLDLAWDDLPPKQRFQFVEQVKATIPGCGLQVASALRDWIVEKERVEISNGDSILKIALISCGFDTKPRARTPKLCAVGC